MGSRPSQRVGWVERSDTHQLHFADMMGFARAQPILRTRCYSCAFFQCKAHARLRVQWASGVPHALFGPFTHYEQIRIGLKYQSVMTGLGNQYPGVLSSFAWEI